MKFKFAIMDVETLKIQNPKKESGEKGCFIFLRGATCIEGEVSEQVFREGKFAFKTSLGEVTLVIDRTLRISEDEGYLWAPCNVQGSWTIREYYRILTELINNYGFSCCGKLFWKMPGWLEGWVKDDLIDPE